MGRNRSERRLFFSLGLTDKMFANHIFNKELDQKTFKKQYELIAKTKYKTKQNDSIKNGHMGARDIAWR